MSAHTDTRTDESLWDLFEKPSSLTQNERDRWVALREDADMGRRLSRDDRRELRGLESRMRA